MGQEDVADDLDFPRGGETRQTKQDHPGFDPVKTEHQVSKILVLGDQHRLVIHGKAQHLFIGDAGVLFCYIGDGKASGPQGRHNRPVHAFIG
jgi:hypothetical protein